MEVHEAITRHSMAQHEHLRRFMELDQERERLIEQAIRLCREGKPFSTDEINRVTSAINEHARKGISPTRRYVTPDMIDEYVDRTSRK